MAFVGLPRIDLRDGAAAELAHWTARCRRSAGLSGPADEGARAIVERVRAEGDRAIVELTLQLEGRRLDRLELGDDERQAACARVPPPLAAALELAAERISAFHRTQLVTRQPSAIERGAVRLASRPTPLQRVGVYAPGGTAAYPSSVLMAAVPAKIAGVEEIVLFTPRPSDVVVLAARLAGVARIFAIGGAQAIAAAAFGTQTVPRVDKIVGPGNAWVTAAKRHVYGVCDVDGIAGPSEILVVADRTAEPAVVAADLLSQAEHDELACAVLVTDDASLPGRVDAELQRQLADLPRAEIAGTALAEHGAAVIVRDRDAMIDAANAYAPEHLELLVDAPDDLVARVRTAGAIFVGAWTPEAAGDYTAGPSHVLPTAGAARFGSPLGVWDFVKWTSVLRLDAPALAEQADAIVTLARAEGLEAHARAVEIRLGRRT
jgi:histidinol dehydrogenase